MDRPLRVMLVLTRLNVGGPSVHVVQLARELMRRGIDVTLVAGRETAEEGNMIGWAEARGARPIIVEALTREINPFRDAAALRALYGLMRLERPDVVHTHMAKAGTLGRLAARLARVPRTVHTYHGTVIEGYFSPAKARLFLTIERMWAWRTDALVALSPRLRDDLVRLRIGRPDQIEVIPLGFELESYARADGKRFAATEGGPFRREIGAEENASADGRAFRKEFGIEESAPADGRAFRKEFGIEANTPLVGIVGRLTAIKNHELFLRAAAQVIGAGRLNEVGGVSSAAGLSAFKRIISAAGDGSAAQIRTARPDVRFVIVGDGERRTELERLAAELGLSGHVVFAGWRSDMPAIYAALDVLALTSLNEGTPMTVLEAMAAAKPVVAVNVGGVADIVEDGITGFLVEKRRGGARVEKNAEGAAPAERTVYATASASDQQAAAFAARLLELLADKPRAEAMGRAGRARVLERHSLARMTDALVQIYR